MRRTFATLLVAIALAAEALAQDAPPNTEADPAPRPSERLLAAVREQTDRLEQREQEVAARERAVAALESETLRILDEARTLRLRVEARIDEWESQLGDRVARLSKVYAEMPAARAAPLLEGLGLDLATEVVARMKPKVSAEVLAQMKDPTALTISRRVARPLTTTPEAEEKR